MAITFGDMIYIGNFAELDTDESDIDVENQALLIGSYDATNSQLVNVELGDVNDDNRVEEDDLEPGIPGEDFTYDLGAGSQTSGLDAVGVYNVRVYLADGSTLDTSVLYSQLQNGDVFITSSSGSLDDLSIESIDLLSPSATSTFFGLSTSSVIANSTFGPLPEVKDVFVWSAADLSAALDGTSVGATFTVTGSPDLMTFTDDEDDGAPDDFNPADQDQTLSGTLDGVQFSGNTGSDDVFEFEVAFQITDGTNTFNIYQIDNDANGGSTVAYVSDMPLDPDATYTVLQVDPSVNFDNGSGYEATPTYADLAGPVVGDSGGNTMGVGFTDTDGDIIDGADGEDDVILGKGGNDTISAGVGDDLIYGDHFDPLPAGTTEYVVQGFIKDQNFELTTDSFASGPSTQFDVLTAPVEIRIIDNDSGAGDDDVVSEIPTDTDQLIEINGVLYNFAPDYQVEFLGSDGVTYTMMVIDVDRDGNGVIDKNDPTADPGDTDYEDGQILIPVGAVPPAGVTLTSTGAGILSISNPDYTTLNGGAVITDYDDSIDAGAGDDTVFAGEGADTVLAGSGDDTVYGGVGDDTLVGNGGSDVIYGGEGDDHIVTGADNGTFPGGGDTAGAGEVNQAFGNEGNDTIEGSVAIDLIDGGSGNDTILGRAGADELDGGTGDDTLDGGDDDDVVQGGAGSDTLNGGVSDVSANGTV